MIKLFLASILLGIISLLQSNTFADQRSEVTKDICGGECYIIRKR